VISVYEVVDLLEAAVAAAAADDHVAFASAVAALDEGVRGTAGAIGDYEVDYLLRDLAAALELGEPDAAAAARISAALERLRALGL
jgi:hypothetical protein